MDASILKAGQETDKLPDTYVIFITETDVIGKDKPLYPIERFISIDGEHIPINDGAHIIYVNGAKKGSQTALEKLMHDFTCTQADDMYYKQLADRMRYFKESEKGVETMCKVIEDMRDDLRASIALEMIADNVPLEKVAQYSGLPLEKVKELASKKSA